MQGFMGECPLDLEYTLWDGFWGANIGEYRFQLGMLIVEEGRRVDKLFGIDTQFVYHPVTKLINLLEEGGKDKYIWIGTYQAPKRALEALKNLLISYENSLERKMNF